MIHIGDKIQFRPTANYDKSAGFPEILCAQVTGTVVMINEEHHWYRVEYQMPGCIGHECFPIPVEPEEEEPAPRVGYKRCFEGGNRPMGQAYGNKHIT